MISDGIEEILANCFVCRHFLDQSIIKFFVPCLNVENYDENPEIFESTTTLQSGVGLSEAHSKFLNQTVFRISHSE
jgi:hypothetical protein